MSETGGRQRIRVTIRLTPLATRAPKHVLHGGMVINAVHPSVFLPSRQARPSAAISAWMSLFLGLYKDRLISALMMDSSITLDRSSCSGISVGVSTRIHAMWPWLQPEFLVRSNTRSITFSSYEMDGSAFQLKTSKSLRLWNDGVSISVDMLVSILT